jgi:hypothetical protein
MKKTPIFITILVAAVLFSGGLAAEAQERTERCQDGVCAESSTDTDDTERANYNTTRSNRSTAVGPDDGSGDCDDGDREVTPGVCNDGADAESAAAPAQNYNSSRSNKPSSIQDDGGDINDEEDPIPPAQDYNAARSNKPTTEQDDGGDIDEDEDPIAPAQDYNASRSNRPTSVRDDSDDQTTPYLWQSFRPVGGVEPEDADSDDDGLSDGEESSAPGAARGFVKFNDIKGEVQVDEETGAPRLSRVAVAARDLRNWTAEDRTAFTAFRQAVASNTPEAASLRITQHMLDDDRIEEIEANETESHVRYRANLRLFGFIPVEREVEATAQAGGEVEVDYPWYSFLASKPDTAAIKNIFSLVSETLSGSEG